MVRSYIGLSSSNFNLSFQPRRSEQGDNQLGLFIFCMITNRGRILLVRSTEISAILGSTIVTRYLRQYFLVKGIVREFLDSHNLWDVIANVYKEDTTICMSFAFIVSFVDHQNLFYMWKIGIFSLTRSSQSSLI